MNSTIQIYTARLIRLSADHILKTNQLGELRRKQARKLALLIAVASAFVLLLTLGIVSAVNGQAVSFTLFMLTIGFLFNMCAKAINFATARLETQTAVDQEAALALEISGVGNFLTTQYDQLNSLTKRVV